eukprot:Clim_evm26s241 gene=Clim_evmTU26s241
MPPTRGNQQSTRDNSASDLHHQTGFGSFRSPDEAMTQSSDSIGSHSRRSRKISDSDWSNAGPQAFLNIAAVREVGEEEDRHSQERRERREARRRRSSVVDPNSGRGDGNSSGGAGTEGHDSSVPGVDMGIAKNEHGRSSVDGLSDSSSGGAFQLSRTQLAVILTTTFIDFAGFGMLLPLLAYYFTMLPGFDHEHSGWWIGVLSGAYSAGQLVGNLTFGSLSDRYGRRSLLLVTLFLSACFFLVTGFVFNLYLLVAVRFMTGVFATSQSICSAYVSDLTVGRTRGRYLGLVGACLGLGIICGPFIGSSLGLIFGVQRGWLWTAVVASGICFCNFLFALKILPESPRFLTPEQREEAGYGAWVSPEEQERLILRRKLLRKQQQTTAGPNHSTDVNGSIDADLEKAELLSSETNDPRTMSMSEYIHTVTRALMQRDLALLMAALFFASFVFVILENLVALYVKERWNLPPEYAGILFGVYGLIIVLTRAGCYAWVERNVGIKWTIVISSGISSLCIFVLPFYRKPWSAILNSYVLSAAQGFLTPCHTVAITHLSKNQYGAIMGFRSIFNEGARTLAPFLGGFLYDLPMSFPSKHAHAGAWFGAALLGTIATVLLICVDGDAVEYHDEEDEEDEEVDEQSDTIVVEENDERQPLLQQK